MRKIWLGIVGAVVCLALVLVVVGRGSSSADKGTTAGDKMGTDKMGTNNGTDRMGTDKMGGDRMGTEKMGRETRDKM
jgi:pentapeptide MXKDX repeat protein